MNTFLHVCCAGGDVRGQPRSGGKAGSIVQDRSCTALHDMQTAHVLCAGNPSLSCRSGCFWLAVNDRMPTVCGRSPSLKLLRALPCHHHHTPVRMLLVSTNSLLSFDNADTSQRPPPYHGPIPASALGLLALPQDANTQAQQVKHCIRDSVY
jgi:hypothetical protein